MIESIFIKDILDLTCEDFSAGDLLRHQIPLLVESDREHTNSGVFVHFVSDNEIENYKIDTDKLTTFDIYGNPFEILARVEIRNESLSIQADAYVHLTNGIIDYLEIWNGPGDYPLTDPQHYQLHQKWLNPTKRRTIIR